jgi:hypothetical protein
MISKEKTKENTMSWHEILQRIDREIRVGTEVPKTKGGTRPVTKKMNSRIYLRTGIKTQAEKFTTIKMLRYAYNTIRINNVFKAKNLKSKFKDECKQGTCVFSMTGGILVVLKLARYDCHKKGYISVKKIKNR